MPEPQSPVYQLVTDFSPPESGRRVNVLLDNAATKVVLFGFAAGDGLGEHAAPHPATLQIVSGEADLTVGSEKLTGTAGTWVAMDARVVHSIQARTPLLLLLTLMKGPS